MISVVLIKKWIAHLPCNEQNDFRRSNTKVAHALENAAKVLVVVKFPLKSYTSAQINHIHNFKKEFGAEKNRKWILHCL